MFLLGICFHKILKMIVQTLYFLGMLWLSLFTRNSYRNVWPDSYFCTWWEKKYSCCLLVIVFQFHLIKMSSIHIVRSIHIEESNWFWTDPFGVKPVTLKRTELVFKTSLVNQTVFLLNQFYFCFNRKSSLKTGSVLKPVRNRFRTCSIHNQFFKISLVSNWFSKTVQTFGFKNQTC